MNSHCKILLIIAGLFGASGIILASVGAHGAQDRLIESNLLDAFSKAVDYSLYNAIALIAIAALCQLFSEKPKSRFHWAGYSIALGGFIFQASLFLYTLAGFKWLTAVTPLGGMLMIGGWLMVSVVTLLTPKNLG